MTRRLIILSLIAVLTMLSTPGARAADVAVNLLSEGLNQHNAIMMLIDPDSGRILDANDAAGRFYGWSLSALRTMRIQDINTLGPDEVAKERAKAKMDRRNYFIFPHRLASGDIRTVEVYSAPVSGAAGKTLLLSIIHDITGKMVAESELSAYRNHLEELVTQRTQEALDSQVHFRLLMIIGLIAQTFLITALIIAYRRRRRTLAELATEAHIRIRAEEKLSIAKSDLQRFAEVSAHHLQEPTRRIIVFSQRLRKLLNGRNNENIDFTLKTIEEQSTYLHALIRDVQIYLAADTPLAQTDLIDPGRIAAAIAAEMAPRIADKHARINIATLPPIHMDAPRLRYLFSALLDNALRYAGADSPPVVRIDGESNADGAAIIRICDNGPGIEPQYRKRVLEVFEHLHHDNAGNAGTGLGLAVARRIVESMDGHISIDDSPEGGTMITLTLPQGD